ncbi:MAG: hypothetical protein MH472_00025, partial [Bacteroidia bacterium]|nr:hypothetical protein [Bacteroidia bacterium]
MKKHISLFLILLSVLSLSYAQQFRSPSSATSAKDLEQIFEDNFTLTQVAIQKKAAELNIPV